VTPSSIRQKQRASSALTNQSNQTTHYSETRTNDAAMLINEVAEELRAPLASAYKSIESIRNGDAGVVTGGQRAMLESAISRFDDLDRMIRKIAQIETRNSVAPPRRRSIVDVHRGSVDVTDIRASVDATLRAQGLPASIDVLWDGADTPGLAVFADPRLLPKMLVQLVTQSVGVTPKGGCVLVRLQTQPYGEIVRWSVIDQGPGIRESEIQRILNRDLDNREGFGLAECQQIASLHFSSLDLYSRIGSGTDISFDTPRLGPRSVASVWSRWRSAQSKLLLQNETRADETSESVVAEDSQQHFRVDSSPTKMSLSRCVEQPRHNDQMTAGTVTLGATVSRTSADVFDRFAQHELQMFDLVYRVGTRRWVWGFDNDLREAGERIESMIEGATALNSGIRMNWSRPQMIPIDDRLTNRRLSDLMIREALIESRSSGIVDKNTVRLGTAPIQQSQTTTDRLNEELHRLSNELKSQTERLQRQARHLRPRS